MSSSPRIDDETLERFRAYLKLLACSQIGSFHGRQLDASDIVQQTLLDAVARTDQFQGTSEFELFGWLREILANNLIDAIRYHGRAKRDFARNQSLDDSVTQSFRRVDVLADSLSTPSQHAVRNEELLRLPDALDSLSDGQREAVVLHHLQGLKLAEIGERMGKSESAVGGLLHRGLKRLHQLLDE